MEVSTPGVVLGIIVILVLLVMLASARSKCGGAAGFLTGGPYNIGLNDQTYEHYPFYAGEAATRWDGDKRCVAYCEQQPCTIWCR